MPIITHEPGQYDRGLCHGRPVEFSRALWRWIYTDTPEDKPVEAVHGRIESVMVGSLDHEVQKIAAQVLRVPTLTTRNSDRLDFHELSVWQIKEALEQAYAAGFKAGQESEEPSS